MINLDTYRDAMIKRFQEGGEFEEMSNEINNPDVERLADFYMFLLDKEEFQDLSEDEIVNKVEELAHSEDGLALLNKYAKEFSKSKKKSINKDEIINSMKNGGRIDKLVNKYKNN